MSQVDGSVAQILGARTVVNMDVVCSTSLAAHSVVSFWVLDVAAASDDTDGALNCGNERDCVRASIKQKRVNNSAIQGKWQSPLLSMFEFPLLLLLKSFLFKFRNLPYNGFSFCSENDKMNEARFVQKNFRTVLCLDPSNPIF